MLTMFIKNVETTNLGGSLGHCKWI